MSDVARSHGKWRFVPIKNNLFAQLFKSWPLGRAAGGNLLKSTGLPRNEGHDDEKKP
jgi:hypothetical protein